MEEEMAQDQVGVAIKEDLTVSASLLVSCRANIFLFQRSHELGRNAQALVQPPCSVTGQRLITSDPEGVNTWRLSVNRSGNWTVSPFLKGKLAPNLGGCQRHTSAKQKNPRKRNTQDLRKKGTNQGTQNKSQVDSDAISHESNQDKLGKTKKGQRAVGRCFFKKKVDFSMIVV